ncbi:hypothetical protein CN223_25370 [Sinorhizobium meliloti]|nr:hypothetical protein CN223_25370 [Sinorhizobium meliloti]
MAVRTFKRRTCAGCGRPHPNKGDRDFDPPKFCAACSTDRRASARVSLGIGAGVVYSADGRYVLPEVSDRL